MLLTELLFYLFFFHIRVRNSTMAIQTCIKGQKVQHCHFITVVLSLEMEINVYCDCTSISDLGRSDSGRRQRKG